MSIAIGLDIGTTTICGIALECASGRVLLSETLPNDSFLPGKNSYERLQDPEKIMAKVFAILDKLQSRCGIPACIGISGQMHGIVYLNTYGKAVSPLYIWQDMQSSQIMEKTGKSYSAVLSELTGYPVADGYGTATHYCLTQTGQLPENASGFCTIGDYAAMRLCEKTSPVIHPSNGASLGVFSLEENTFDQKALKKAGIDPTFFPQVTEDFALCGYTRDGIPVAVALGDNQASFLGSVRDSGKTVLVNVGTGSQISMVGKEILSKGAVESRPFFGGHYLLAGSSLCGGRAYAALISFFQKIAALAGKKSWDTVYEDIGKLLGTKSSQNASLRFSTLLCGSRSCPDERGSITGLSLENFTPEDFAWAALEGICGELFEMYTQMISQLSSKESPVLLVGSGNGIRKNPALQKLFEERFHAKLQIPLYQEEASYGAALYAMTCSGLVRDLSQAQSLIQYQ